MKYVYVISKTGQPLMPTCRYRHVRWLLKQKKARVVSREPFTIQLLYETTEYTQPLVLGIDPGVCAIGTAVRREDGEIVFAGELGVRSRQVTKNMGERQMHRRSRRNYRRLRRTRRAKKAGTQFGAKSYRIVGIEAPLECKKIRPKLVRFYNRKRKAGWLTPTARHLLETHQNFVKKIASILPIAKAAIEYAQFDTHKLVNPEVQGKEYQDGPQKGYANEREYVLHRDRHTCQLCKETRGELHVHHVIWRKHCGSDSPENLLTLCKQCHILVHEDSQVDKKVKQIFSAISKRHAPPTLLNTIMPELCEWLGMEFPAIELAYGYETKEKRRKCELEKEHYVDAYVVSLAVEQIEREKIADCVLYEFKQFRRHSRQLIHARRDRNYYEGKRNRQDKRVQSDESERRKSRIVAKNRHKKMGQTSDSLIEYVAKKGKEKLGILCFTKGQKMIRSKNEKFKPGDVVVKQDGTRRVVTGSGHNGYSVTLLFEKKYEIASKCRLSVKNQGIVCVQCANGRTKDRTHADAIGTAQKRRKAAAKISTT